MYSEEFEEALDGFIESILECNEYKDYEKSKNELMRYPDLKEKVDEFRQRNYELQTSNLDGNRLMEEMDKFERDYESFRSNPLVYKFLASELAFIKLMQYVYETITDSIEFE